jgi:hypothetical protein
MSRATFFYQECPVCGRSLRVAVRYFGREMSCSHCRGEFVAGPPSGVFPQLASDAHSPPGSSCGPPAACHTHQLGNASLQNH